MEARMNGNGKETKDKLSITIILDKEKGISVEGPGNGEFYDEAVCFHLMRKGGHFIEAHNAMSQAKQKPLIHKPGLGNRIKGAFGGKG